MSETHTDHGISLVMPISGIKFVNEAYLADEVVRCGAKIDRMLTTSGGSIVAMMMLASDLASVRNFASYKVYHEKFRFIIGELDSDWYCKPRSSIPIINTFMSIGKESSFERGNGEERIKQYAFDASGQPEVWMGTQNADTMAHQVWCTKSQKEASVDMDGINYLDNDINTITKVVIGSCAVPLFVPSIQIGEHTYRDGGMKHASPLGDCLPMFRTAITVDLCTAPRECPRTSGLLPYKIVYISPVRYNVCEDKLSDQLEDDDIWRQMQGSIAGMIADIHLADMNNGVRALGKKRERTTVFGYGDNALFTALKLQKKAKASVIRLSPLEPVYVGFTTMEKGDALRAFDEVSHTEYHVRHDFVL